MFPYVNSRDCVDILGVQTRVLTGSEHVKSSVSISLIHVLPYVNSRVCVDKLGVHTSVYSGSEHVKSHVSMGSIQVVPFVNSRYSVDKLGVQTLLTLVQNMWNHVFQLVQFMFYRTRIHEILWTHFPVKTRVHKLMLTGSEHEKTHFRRGRLVHTINQDKLCRIQLIYCTVMITHNIRSKRDNHNSLLCLHVNHYVSINKMVY